MDIEFIELEHRENVMKLMEICGLDLKEAYELYVDSGYNFEVPLPPCRQQSIRISILPQLPPPIPITRSTLPSSFQWFLTSASSDSCPYCKTNSLKMTTTSTHSTKISSKMGSPSIRNTQSASTRAS